MTNEPSITHSILEWAGILLDVVSAFLGMLGAYWMARKYAPTFWTGFKFAFRSIGKYLSGSGSEVEDFYIQEVRENRDVPELPGSTAMGLNCVFLAFFFQLAKIVLAIFARFF
jgi:hypothetical protein